MIPDILFLKRRLKQVILGKEKQGFKTAGMLTALKKLPDSYDAVVELAQQVAELPFREDWPYSEPNELEQILNQCDSDRPLGPICETEPDDISARIRNAFQGAVCGCILGKPLEIDPTLCEIRKAAESCGEWPLDDYVSDEMLAALKGHHESSHECTRGSINYVAADDDLNYDVIGMLVLEKHGVDFTKDQLRSIWMMNLPPAWTFGPERTFMAQATIHSMGASKEGEPPFDLWTNEWNPGSELCGAAIRVDSYGYAAAGNPALAAELAWRDSSMTHVRTGIYASMYVAAAIATAFVAKDPMEIFKTAIKFVPQKTRFYEVMTDCFTMVQDATDWLDGYRKINEKYGEYGHCQLYQECGQLINTAKFAENVSHAFCMQVAQGCDTDCFGEIIGSIMGAYFGPGHLEERWLAPFNDDFRTSLGDFHERSLTAVTERMAELPGKIRGRIRGTSAPTELSTGELDSGTGL